MSKRLPVHVVLVNYNRWADTIECLESLLRSDYPELKVIVVDNCSEDDSVERIRRWASGEEAYAAPAKAPTSIRNLSWPPVRKPVDYEVRSSDDVTPVRLPQILLLAHARNSGFAGGNNVAMRMLLDRNASGYVCLINNDMVVAPAAISAMVRAIEQDNRIGAMGGVMLEYFDPERVQMVGGGHRSLLATGEPIGAGLRRGSVPQTLRIGYVSGGVLLTRLEMLRDVGLLDEYFFLYAEDRDLGLRIEKAGYKNGYITDAEVWHKGSATVVSRSPFQDYHVVRAQLQFVRKHSPWLVPLVLAYSLFRSMTPKILRGEWRRGITLIHAYRDFLGSRAIRPRHLLTP